MLETQVNEPTEVTPPKPPVEPLLRRSARERHPSQKYSHHEFVLLTDGEEPRSYEEAMLHEEMKSLHKNHNFELVKLYFHPWLKCLQSELNLAWQQV